jgi:hypothetical protein
VLFIEQWYRALIDDLSDDCGDEGVSQLDEHFEQFNIIDTHNFIVSNEHVFEKFNIIDTHNFSSEHGGSCFNCLNCYYAHLAGRACNFHVHFTGLHASPALVNANFATYFDVGYSAYRQFFKKILGNNISLIHCIISACNQICNFNHCPVFGSDILYVNLNLLCTEAASSTLLNTAALAFQWKNSSRHFQLAKLAYSIDFSNAAEFLTQLITNASNLRVFCCNNERNFYFANQLYLDFICIDNQFSYCFFTLYY